METNHDLTQGKSNRNHENTLLGSVVSFIVLMGSIVVYLILML